jgi:hypothetical protein
MFAITRDNTNMAKLLLDNHADANLESTYFSRGGPGSGGGAGMAPMAPPGRPYSGGPMSPLLWAIANSRTQMVQLLLDHGAKPNATNMNGSSALVQAILRRNFDAVRLLIEHGADVNLLDKEGRPPLAVLRSSLAETGFQNGRRRGLSGSPSAEANGPLMEALLIKAGADADYDRRRAIWTYGDDGSPKDEIFQCPSNSINHYTLLEFLATLYQVNPPQNPLERMGTYAYANDLVPFPEFARVSIHRLDGKRTEVLRVNVEAILRAGDGAKDVALQPGDLIEIAKQEHKVADTWYGLSAADVTAMTKFLVRKVSVVSKGHTNYLALVPSLADAAEGEHFHASPPQAFPVAGTNWLAEVRSVNKTDTVIRSFLLYWAVRDANVLLNTWDLSRVQLIRGDAKMTFDLTANPAPNDWLEDGDVIEIPELGDVGPAAEAK